MKFPLRLPARFTFARSRYAIALLLSIVVWIQIYFYTAINSQESSSQSRSSTEIYVLEDTRPTSRHYQYLLQKYGGDVTTLPYHEKCNIFFDELYMLSPEWKNNDFSEYDYNGDLFEGKDQFVKQYIEHYRNKEVVPGLTEEEIDKLVERFDIKKEAEHAYEKALLDARNVEQLIIDVSTIVRVYGGCFLDQYGELNQKKDSQKSKIDTSDLETRIFPWLSGILPIYTRWDGLVLRRNIPVMSDYIKVSSKSQKQTTKKQKGKNKGKTPLSRMKAIRDLLNGKGIAISAADRHLPELARLIPLLRALGNKLPIQIVHKGDLTDPVIAKIVRVARGQNINLRKIPNFNAFLRDRAIDFNNEGIEGLTEEQKEALYPKQEIWFVNMKDAISPNYASKFNTYANKFLAYFFSSFEDLMLIDTDTIPLVNLERYIFESEFYKQHQAYFFKDRELFFQGKFSDRKFFEKLMPTVMDYGMFNIPESTNFTLNNRFIGLKFLHFMESGVVAINKKAHFTGILTTLQLQIWAPAASKFWGDKELFWLGLSIAGDEDYYMNELPAGSIGQITPKEQRRLEDKDDSKRKQLLSNELCSTHPTHISPVDNSTILWFNSGFQYCKIDSAKDDFTDSLKTKKAFQSVEEVDNFYKSPIQIDTVIIPKHAERYVPNDIGDSSRGWEMTQECHAYMFCAYDMIGAKDDPDTNGLLIKVDEAQKELYGFYGEVWIAGDRLLKTLE